MKNPPATNKEHIREIEEFFKPPKRVADQIKIVAEKVKGGYILLEMRPRWDTASAPWTKSAIAKFIFHTPSQYWKLYWMRASGTWRFYGQYKTFKKILRAISEDAHGCFWG